MSCNKCCELLSQKETFVLSYIDDRKIIKNDGFLLGFGTSNLLGLFRRFGGKCCFNFRVTEFGGDMPLQKLKRNKYILPGQKAII
jgi:hypothetical protein